MAIRVALITMIKPHTGSGEGITEYVHKLYSGLEKTRGIEVTCIYPLEEAKRVNVVGYALAHAYFFSKHFTKRLAEGKYDVIHIANEELGFLAGRIRKISPGSRIVLTLHGLSRAQRGYHRGALQNAYNFLRIRGGIRSAMRNSDFVIFNSSLTESDAAAIFGREYSKDRSEVIHLGISKKFSGKAAGKKKGGEKFVVGYVGSFTYLKNVMFILKTAALLKDAKGFGFSLYGFGSGQELREMESFKRRHALSEVRFNGVATSEKIEGAYASFDAFMFPSRYEGFGLPILEAQAMGLPVIVYKRGKIASEVRRYCLEADSEGAAAKILKDLRMYGYEDNLRNRAMMYAHGFTWEKTVRETVDVYKRTLSFKKQSA